MRTHRVWKLGANVDTDALAPGRYMQLGVDGIAPHCLEVIRPDFAARVRAGDVVAAGPGFGIGSSREQAAAVLIRLGVRAVIAPSYGGLFFRNAFNLGLLVLTSPEAQLLEEGEHVGLDLAALAIVRSDGRVLKCDPIPEFLLARAAAGGLMNELLRARQKAAGV